MNKRYVIGGAIIVLAILVGFFFGKRSAIAPSSQDMGVPLGTIATTTATTTLIVPHVVPKPAAPKVVTQSSVPASPLMTANGAYLVMYTNNGFSPSTLTIKKGQSVHFVNYSNKAMSLTAIDQNSQVYRNFNQEQSVGRGGYFDFSFVTSGTWGYTNRNSLADRGIIVVE